MSPNTLTLPITSSSTEMILNICNGNGLVIPESKSQQPVTLQWGGMLKKMQIHSYVSSNRLSLWRLTALPSFKQPCLLLLEVVLIPGPISLTVFNLKFKFDENFILWFHSWLQIRLQQIFVHATIMQLCHAQRSFTITFFEFGWKKKRFSKKY